MTAKVLQMVNSAFFGVRRHISSPTEAVGLLGLDTIMTLVLTIQIFSQFEDECLANFSPAALWAHSLQVGLFAKRLSQAAGQGGEVVKDAFTAGLLHDAGQLVLAANLPRQFAESLELAQAEKLSHHEAERQVFGATHSEVGAYLFGLWGLPQSIVEAVAYHHRPADCVAEGFGPLTAVHVGNALERETQALPPEWCFAALDMDYLAKLGLADRLPEWRDLYIRVAKDQSA
jgi:HD-like signal output (HDOD) protein